MCWVPGDAWMSGCLLPDWMVMPQGAWEMSGLSEHVSDGKLEDDFFFTRHALERKAPFESEGTDG